MIIKQSREDRPVYVVLGQGGKGSSASLPTWVLLSVLLQLQLLLFLFSISTASTSYLLSSWDISPTERIHIYTYIYVYIRRPSGYG